MIPLKQMITVTQGGELDAWGKPAGGTQTVYQCRIDEESKLLKDAQGKDVLATVEILMKGFVPIGFRDRIEWLDEAERTRKKSPLLVQVIRDLSGKPLFTKVTV
ncbi:hypothetical protein H1S01_11350 [Heliobacterium chlorum]|uniref:Uncharacterized protein n=1 Tax=Heliobacterium chlorum TaxID=2698 RepID=A0ABR7T2V5_HELCL|nr:hypothetical protein [Heliobacterium chlorum]MBC9785103.1 hypothetical protein [Heliobacterium chlorum]